MTPNENRVGTEELLAALVGATTIELSHDLRIGIPCDAAHPDFFFTPHYRQGDFQLGDGYGGANEIVVMCGHSGTHIDALSHASRDGEMFGGIQVDEAQDGIRGMVRHGIESVPPIIRRGVLLDVAAARRVEALEPAAPVDGADLQLAAERAGVEVRPGDCVLVRTGFGAFWEESDRYLGLADGAPGVSLDGARWLTSRGVYLAGSDTAAFEQEATDGPRELPVHLHMLQETGTFIVENLALEEAAADGWQVFLFIVLPLPLAGATGSPVRPVGVRL